MSNAIEQPPRGSLLSYIFPLSLSVCSALLTPVFDTMAYQKFEVESDYYNFVLRPGMHVNRLEQCVLITDWIRYSG